MHFQNKYQIGTRFREMGADPHRPTKPKVENTRVLGIRN